MFVSFEYKWEPHPLECRGRENEESEISSKWLFRSTESSVADATRGADNVFSIFLFHHFRVTVLLLSSPCRKFCFVYTSFSRSFISQMLPRLHPFETMWNVVASHFSSSKNILRATDNGLIPSFLTAIFLVPQKTERQLFIYQFNHCPYV